MKCKITLCFLLGFIILTGIASALTTINIYLDNSGNADFFGDTNEIIPLPSGINASNGEIRGITSELTSKAGEVWNFSYSLPDSEFKVYLPQGARIISISEGEIYTEKENIVLFFIDKGEVSYTVEPFKKYPSSLILAVFFILVLTFLLLITNKNSSKNIRESNINNLKNNRRISKDKKLSIIKGVLHEKENLILAKVKELEKAKSSYIRKSLNMPKASFSRHIQELEKKGIIKREGLGRNKIISLR